MQFILSKVGLDNGYTRRISVDMFADRAAVEALPAKDPYPAREGVAAHDGAAFVLAETSAAAVAGYAALRASGMSQMHAFAQAFKAYFVPDHDLNDFAAAAANFESSASYADNVAEAQAEATSSANKKAAESAALAAQKAQEAADAAKAAADAAQAHAEELAAAASTGE